MTYEIITEPHTCELPPPENFELGVEILCGMQRLLYGSHEPCRERYVRSQTFWGGHPIWKRWEW